MTSQWKPLTDYQWAAILPFFDLQRKRKHGLRQIMDGILWLLRTGCQWRHLPPSWPHWQAVYYSFTQWKGKGIFEQINAKLNQLDRLAANRQAYPSVLCIDSHGAAGRSVKLSSDIDNYWGTDTHKRVNGPKRTMRRGGSGSLMWMRLTEPMGHWANNLCRRSCGGSAND